MSPILISKKRKNRKKKSFVKVTVRFETDASDLNEIFSDMYSS